MTPSALELYAAALQRPAIALRARRAAGAAEVLALPRWLGALTAADEAVLRRAHAPVLDVGCGPGRHVIGLAQRGRAALGIDVSLAAVRIARRRGARAVCASVFADVPGAGAWGSALLLDGNIGIGGSPATLLRRVRELLRDDGEVLVELAAPGAGAVCERLALELDGVCSRPFTWAFVGADAIDAPARAAGLAVAERWHDGERWFARLVAASAAAPRALPGAA